MKLNRAYVFMKDDRSELRISENERLYWQIKYKQREGVARIRNISTTGMRMETNALFDPQEECILTFETDLGDDNFIPQRGRLVWQKRNPFSRNSYSCGIRFLDADEQALNRMRQRVQEGVQRYVKRRRVTSAVGMIVTMLSAAMIILAIWFSAKIYKDVTRANERILGISSQQALLTQNYMRLYRTSEQSLADKTEKLDIANEIIQENKVALILFEKELEATSALLDRTEEMLTDANEQNTKLSSEILALQAQVEAQKAKELSDSAVADVELTMAEFREKLRDIKQQMRQLKEKEIAARAAAQAEIDHQKALLGNNGYFIRAGEIVQVNDELYERLDVGPLAPPVATQANRDVQIDVTFFE